MTEAGIEFAFLHGESQAAKGQASSDVDIVADRPAADILKSLAPLLMGQSVAPIMMWPYDVGGTASIFFVNENATAGAQIDVCYDPEARGKYGLRSSSALDAAIDGDRWRRLSPPHESAYRIRKRAVKGQSVEVERIVSDVDNIEDVVRAARDLFTESALKAIRRAVNDPAASAYDNPRPRMAGRIIERARFPVGFAIALKGTMSQRLENAVGRFKVILPCVRLMEMQESRPRRIVWYAREVGLLRWRPALVVAVGVSRPRGLGFDYRGEVSSTSAEVIVAAMSRKVLGRHT